MCLSFFTLVAMFAYGAFSTPAKFYLASFRVDVTVPLGHACMGGGIVPATEIVDPLYAHGVILLDNDLPVILVAVDWCEIRNDAYDHWRTALADAAGTVPERVMVASVHQHDAPVVDYEAQRLLDAVGLENSLCNVEFAQQCVQKTASAVREAILHPRPITHYGIGMALVNGLASNRRVVLPDGSVSYGRGSATKDPALRALPEGVIDPYVKTLSFWNHDTPVAAITSYAVHPMSYYGQGGVSADFVGMARARRQADTPDVFQVYFTGCSGDTTVGKFNDGSPENRARLAETLYQGMVAAWRNTQHYPLENITFSCSRFHLPPKCFGGYTEGDARETLAYPLAKTFSRNLAALALSYHSRFNKRHPIDLPLLDLGRALFLVMPGESFVQYQILAQGMRPDALVIVAGFGECAPGYIPAALGASEGYHDESWCWIAPGAEPVLLEALRNVLYSSSFTQEP